jgi:hypothetical protein
LGPGCYCGVVVAVCMWVATLTILFFPPPPPPPARVRARFGAQQWGGVGNTETRKIGAELHFARRHGQSRSLTLAEPCIQPSSPRRASQNIFSMYQSQIIRFGEGVRYYFFLAQEPPKPFRVTLYAGMRYTDKDGICSLGHVEDLIELDRMRDSSAGMIHEGASIQGGMPAPSRARHGGTSCEHA